METRLPVAWLAGIATVMVMPDALANEIARKNTATEFCLHGEFDLGARLQGLRPGGGEFSAASWWIHGAWWTRSQQMPVGRRRSQPMAGERFVIPVNLHR